MQELRADTQVIVTVGPFVDVGDGFTPQTDIALSGNEAELIKHGSTAVVDISGATWAAVTSCRGYYSLTLTTGHTDTEGLLVVIVQDDSDCLPVKQEYMVLSQAAWDSKYVARASGRMPVDLTHVMGTALSEGGSGRLAAALVKLLDVATPLLVASDVMRGTDSAALASVLGALADAAADGDPTSADTVMQYLKQIVNTLVGTAGIPTFPAEAAPGNAVSLAEVLRAIHADVTGLNGSAMIGTNSAALATVCTEARLAALTDWIDGGRLDLILDIIAADTTTDIPVLIAALNNISTADVNAQVLDVLNVDTFAQPGQEAPAATTTLSLMLRYLYKFLRNKKTQTATTLSVFNDDAATVDQKATVSDDGTTFTKGEIATGP